MDLKEQLFALSAAAGPTGREDGAAELAAQLLAPLVDRVERDAMGNVLGWRMSANPKAKTLLLDAHLDEVALIVTGQEEGFLRFAPLNCGVDERLLPGLRVRVLSEQPMDGVITCLPPHALTAAEREKPFEMDKLRIDVGLTQEQARQQVPTGTAVIYGTRPFSMGPHRVCGKSFDDRACFTMLLAAADLLKDKDLPLNVCILGSTQEESGMAGVRAAAFRTAPDFALVTDVTFGKTPDSPSEGTFPLNCGPIIGVGPVLHRRLTNQLIACAERIGVPYMREIAARSTGTNAMQTQISRMGVPTVQISVPLQYMHTPTEVIDLRDLEQSAKLIAEFIFSCGEGAMA